MFFGRNCLLLIKISCFQFFYIILVDIQKCILHYNISIYSYFVRLIRLKIVESLNLLLSLVDLVGSPAIFICLFHISAWFHVHFFLENYFWAKFWSENDWCYISVLNGIHWEIEHAEKRIRNNGAVECRSNNRL